MAGEIRFKEERIGNYMKVYIAGEVDIYTSQALKEKLYALVDANEGDLNVDCKELNYIDSTGLGIFVGALKKAKQNGKEIIISNLKENIKKLFIITGLNNVFVMEE